MSGTGRVTWAASVAAMVAIAGVVWAASPSPVYADNTLILPGGGASVTLGANSVLRIDGRLNFSNNCASDGYDDFVYPASDVYIVESGFTGGDLVDVGAMPNTIVQGASMFLGEVIAITQPAGELGEGTYSIVFDTCQDERYDPAVDTIFEDAITVVFPPVMPPIDDSIRAVKTNARTEWGSWNQVMRSLENLENLQRAQNAIECATGNAVACLELFELIDTNPGMTYAMEGTKRLVANMIKSYGGIYADPPRADFTTPSTAVVGDDPMVVLAGSGDAKAALSELATALEREVAVREALLAAVERYQGAQAAGDPVAALSQLRTAAGLATVLADSEPATVALLGAYADQLDTLGVDTLSQQRWNTFGRYRIAGGLNAAEDRALRNQGVAGQERVAFFDQILHISRNTTLVLPLDWLETHVAGMNSRQAANSAALDTLAADLLDVAAEITGVDPDGVPTISLPAAVGASAGAALAIDATASPGSTVTWDLDADGSFDDGTGPSVSATFAAPGHRVIAARATNAVGASVVAHALVEVTATNLPPTITSAAPDHTQSVAGAVGAPTTFTVTAADPTGDPLSYQWHLGGEPVDDATSASLTLTPTVDERGHHTVAVTVSDGQPGNQTVQAWSWLVSDADADRDGWAANAYADCDDANGDVHPGRPEQLYNGVDDDCDPATPDQPLELAVGQLWGWGTGDGAPGTGSNVSTAVPRYQNVDNVAQAVAAWGAGALLDDDGYVWSWGAGIGIQGDGNPNSHTVNTPQPVVPPGWAGGEGQLGGITSLTSAFNWMGALTADGRVLTWGRQSNGALGQGFTPQQQSSAAIPGYVVDAAAPGGEPIEGVVAIEGGYGSGYAILADGTAMTWGVRLCLGGAQGTPRSDWAVASPHMSKDGTTIVQIEGGNQSYLVRHSDGTVSWCRITNQLPQRLTLDTFGGQRAVDLATVGNGAGGFVLTEDGSLWVTGAPLAFQIEPLTTEAPVSHDGWVRVILPDGPKVVALDGEDVPCAIFAIREDGSALSWGDTNRNCHGQGGATVLSGSNHATPGQLDIAGRVRDVSGGGYNTVAVVGREGGDVWTWGTGGALGRTGTNAGQTPGAISGLTNVVELAATGDAQATYALKADGSVVGWTSGQPGSWYFTATSNNTVQPVKGVGGQGALTGVTHLVSGRGTVAALRDDGRVVTWGFGQDALGGGPDAPLNRFYPDYVLGPDLEPISDVVDLWGGASGYVARQADGTLLQWGRRDCAGHSIGVAASVSDVAIPPDAEWPTDLVQYASDSAPNPLGIARLADGSVMTCGEPPTNVYQLQPVAEFGPHNPAVDVAVGANQTRLVVTSSGEVWVKTDWTAFSDALGVPRFVWTRLELPDGAFAIGVNARVGSFQVRLADGSLLTFGTSTQHQTGRGPSDTPGLSADWRLLPAWVDGFVLDNVVEGWNAAAIVIPTNTLQRSGWVPPQIDVAISVVGGSGPEGGSASAGVVLSRPADGDVTVEWEFEGVAGTTVVAAGETSADVSLALPEPDGVWALDRSVPFVLTGVDAGARLADDLAEVTVVDADPPPVVTIEPGSVGEGDGALVAHTITIALSRPAGIDLPVTLTATDGAALAEVDFKEVELDLLVPAGATSVVAPLVVLGNTVPQADRGFTLTVTPDHDGLTGASRAVTILDDDPLALTASSDRVRAGQPAAVELRVPRLPAGESMQIAWATVEGNAKPGVDYVAGSGTITVTGNVQDAGTGTITLATLDSGAGEAALSLLVRLTPTSGTGREVLAADQVVVAIDRPASTPPSSPAPPSTPAPTPTIPTPPDAPFPPSRYVPLSPARLFDTRPDHPGAGPKGLVGPDSSIDIQATGRLGVPDDAVAVVLNVTVTETTAASHVTVHPTGQERPLASSINNVRPGQTRPNLVTVPVGDGGRITLYSLEPAHLLADVAGYYLATDHAVAGGRFVPLPPQRLFDTRPGTPAPGHKGRLAPAETLRVQVSGVGDVPASGIAAVVINLTGADATAAGFITAYPTGQDLPLASNVNLSGPGDTAPNLAIVPLGADGAINVYSSHGTHALGDVTGYVTDATTTPSTTGLFVPLHPTRVFDTRPDETPPGPKGAVAAGAAIDVHVAGAAGIPATATGAVLNIVGIQSPVGHLTIWPTGLDQPLASTLNFSTQPVDTRANAAMLPLGEGGRMTIYTLHGGHVLADTTGYFL